MALFEIELSPTVKVEVLNLQYAGECCASGPEYASVVCCPCGPLSLPQLCNPNNGRPAESLSQWSGLSVCCSLWTMMLAMGGLAFAIVKYGDHAFSIPQQTFPNTPFPPFPTDYPSPTSSPQFDTITVRMVATMYMIALGMGVVMFTCTTWLAWFAAVKKRGCAMFGCCCCLVHPMCLSIQGALLMITSCWTMTGTFIWGIMSCVLLVGNLHSHVPIYAAIIPGVMALVICCSTMMTTCKGWHMLKLGQATRLLPPAQEPLV